MALTSLLCSLFVLVALLACPEKYSVLVDAARSDHYRNVDPSMLRSAGAVVPQQQAIQPFPEAPVERPTTPTPPEVSDAPRIVQDLIRGESAGNEKSELLQAEEDRPWSQEGHRSRRPKRPGGPNHRSARRPGLDPRKTWQAFLRHTEHQQSQDKKKGSHKKVSALHLRNGARTNVSDREIQLAPVDNNPRTRNTMSRQEMIEHLRDLIRDATERGLSHVDSKCGVNSTKAECIEKRNPAGSPILEIERAALIPETHSAFTWRLGHKFKIRKQRELELRDFYRPVISGTVERGDGLHADEGRFQAPTGGLFVFHANVHFNVSSNGPPDGVVTLKLCIDSNCAANFGLSAMRAIGAPEVFTLSLGGPVHLMAGQSVSLFVSNKSRSSAIRVLDDSTFTGFMTSHY